MFAASRKSKQKIFHEEHCPYARLIRKENRIYFATADDALRAGYSPCGHCGAVSRAFRKEKAALYSFCAANGVQLFVARHQLHIRTPWSAWIIAPGEAQSLRLFHKNKKKRPSDGLEKRYPGYHEQNSHQKDLLSYMKYILRHDAYRLAHPCRKYTPAPLPRKGTKRYKKWEKENKALLRRHQIGNVLTLIENLSGSV